MTYVDGFVIAVPTANKDRFIETARKFDTMLIEHGALRVMECWGDDLKHGKLTDFYRATHATDAETVAFSWVEWPDKASRDAAHAKMEELMSSGAEAMDMPFDGARMIFGGFVPVLELKGR
ncbi:MAG: DUF1428 domain-containing protein [Pseudomonadota bacterium]